MSNVTINVALPAKVVAAFLRSYTQFMLDTATVICETVIDVVIPVEVIEAWQFCQATLADLPTPHMSQVTVNGTPLAKPPRKRTAEVVH